MDQQRKRVERAVSDMIEDMYKTHLRKMQGDMHLCAARCCDDPRGNLDSVQGCIQTCAQPLMRAQDFLQHELAQFQGRLQHCVMECNDNARVNMPSQGSGSEVAKYHYQYERCMTQCVDKHIGLLPQMMRSLKATLSKGPDSKK